MSVTGIRSRAEVFAFTGASSVFVCQRVTDSCVHRIGGGPGDREATAALEVVRSVLRRQRGTDEFLLIAGADLHKYCPIQELLVERWQST
jgi:hypothetical protein